MATTTDHIHSNGSNRKSYRRLDEWISKNQNNQESSSTPHFSSKLTAEIHSAIIGQTEEYASSICDHLFTLYRHVSHRQIVLQFLPSFITAYYDVLHHHLPHHHHQRSHPEFVDARTKDVYSTIDTFLVSLYSLGVTDYRQDEKKSEIRIPNLTQPSIYHEPNVDHYTPVPLTQSVISRHENKPEIIRQCSFASIDSVNLLNREKMIWFLLIQYGNNVSSMDELSFNSYVQMTIKLVAQGFPFAPRSSETSIKKSSRRIHLSSQMMTEILGTLIYIKTAWKSDAPVEAMRLVKKRAEHELFTDVMLMTESLEYLHEFDVGRNNQRDQIGIELKSPASVDLVRQKRSVIANRSMKSRNRPGKLDDSISDENSGVEIMTSNPDRSFSETTPRRRTVLNAADNNPIRPEAKNGKINQENFDSSPNIDQPRTFVSAIGPATSSPSTPKEGRIKSSYIREVTPTSPADPPVRSEKTKRKKEQSESTRATMTVVHQENSRQAELPNEFEETYF